MLSAQELLSIIDKNAEKSRYFRIVSDGRKGFYGETQVEVVDNGKGITRIISALEEKGMEWYFADCDTLPKLHGNGKYYLRIDVGRPFYFVKKKGLYEVMNCNCNI